MLAEFIRGPENTNLGGEIGFVGFAEGERHLCRGLSRKEGRCADTLRLRERGSVELAAIKSLRIMEIAPFEPNRVEVEC